MNGKTVDKHRYDEYTYLRININNVIQYKRTPELSVREFGKSNEVGEKWTVRKKHTIEVCAFDEYADWTKH